MSPTDWRSERTRIVDMLTAPDIDDSGLLVQIRAVSTALRDLSSLRVSLQLDALKIYPASSVGRASGMTASGIRMVKNRSVKSA